MKAQLPSDLSFIFNNTKGHLIDNVQKTVRADTEFGCAYYEVIGRIVMTKLNELNTLLSPADVVAYMDFYIRLNHFGIPVRYGGVGIYLPHKREIMFTFVDLNRLKEELQRKLKHPIKYTTDLEAFSMKLIENHNKFLNNFFQKIREKKVKEVEQMVNSEVTLFLLNYPVYQISVNANISVE